MSKEIPQKGWFISKKGNSSGIDDTLIYLNGKELGGVKKLSIEFDSENLLPTLKLEILALDGLTLDAFFEKINIKRSEDLFQSVSFQSSLAPEDILKAEREKNIIEENKEK